MTSRMQFRWWKSLCVFLFLIATTLGVRGELPPWVYKDLQDKSPEALIIKVESVKISTTDEPTFKSLSIAVKARVETVIRSASSLKPGDIISINYVRLDHKQSMPGPSEPDVLQQGRTYSAFLTKTEKNGTYTTAAKGYSFRTTD